MVERFQGHQTRHHYYTREWRGRIVTLQYSKMNGCGTITFGATEQEKQEAAERQKINRKERELKGLRRLRERHPDRFLERLEQAWSGVRYWKEELADNQADPDMSSCVPRDLEYLAEAQETVRLMEPIL